MIVRVRRSNSTTCAPDTQAALLERSAVERLDKASLPVGRHFDNGGSSAQINTPDLLSAQAAGGAEEVQDFALGGALRQRFQVEKHLVSRYHPRSERCGL